MKNLSFGLSLVSFAGVVILSFLYSSNGSKTKDSASAAKGKSPVSETVYVNTDSILTYYEYFIDMKDGLDSKQMKAKAQLESRAKSFEKKVASLQSRVKAQTISQNDFNKSQNALAQEEMELRNYEQTLSNGLLAETQEINNKAYDNIIKYLKEWNKDKGYNFVVTYVKGGNILLANDGLDITQEVLDGINKQYKAEKKAGNEQESKN